MKVIHHLSGLFRWAANRTHTFEGTRRRPGCGRGFSGGDFLILGIPLGHFSLYIVKLEVVVVHAAQQARRPTRPGPGAPKRLPVDAPPGHGPVAPRAAARLQVMLAFHANIDMDGDFEIHRWSKTFTSYVVLRL